MYASKSPNWEQADAILKTARETGTKILTKKAEKQILEDPNLGHTPDITKPENGTIGEIQKCKKIFEQDLLTAAANAKKWNEYSILNSRKTLFAMKAGASWTTVFEAAKGRYLEATELLMQGYKSRSEDVQSHDHEAEAVHKEMEVEPAQNKRDAVEALQWNAEPLYVAQQDLATALESHAKRKRAQSTDRTGSAIEVATTTAAAE